MVSIEQTEQRPPSLRRQQSDVLSTRIHFHKGEMEDKSEEEFAEHLLHAPRDRFNFVYIACLMLGVGVLFPWNAFITANDYWASIFPDHDNVEFLFSVIYNFPNIIALIVLVKWGNRVSFTKRIVFGFVVDAIALLYVPILDAYHDRMPENVPLALTYVAVGLTGMCSGILFGTIMGFTAHFPPVYTQAVMAGNGIAGIIVAVLRGSTMAAVPNAQTSALIYFSLACLTVVLALVFYIIMLKRPFTVHHMSRTPSRAPSRGPGSAPRSASKIRSPSFAGPAPDERSSLLGARPSSPEQAESEPDAEAPMINDAPLLAESDVLVMPEARVFTVVKKVWTDGLAVCMVFFVTLALFPGVTSLVPGSSMPANWFTFLMMALFLLFDFVGRTLPRWFVLFNTRTYWIPILLRVAFFPLFVLCVNPRVIPGDIWPCVFMALFAVTNGFLGSVVMMLAPSRPEIEPYEKERTGTVMTFFLNAGILLGVNVALGLDYALTGHV